MEGIRTFTGVGIKEITMVRQIGKGESNSGVRRRRQLEKIEMKNSEKCHVYCFSKLNMDDKNKAGHLWQRKRSRMIEE